MRVLWVAVGLLTILNGARCQPAMSAGQLVHEVVYNEQNDHARHGFWRYWVVRQSQAGTLKEDQVETADGPITRLTLMNGHELSPEAEQQEHARLEKLLNSHEDQARELKQYDEDEERIGHILEMLPTSFVYEYDGEENGCYRLRFRPNQEDAAHSIEARIFHAMSGTLWVDVRSKRLARLEGRIDENVDFGFGLLGRLYKGGWFRLVRVEVSPSDWKTASLDVHMNVRALLVKTFARDTSEVRGGFVSVPAGMSLREGLALLGGPHADSNTLAFSQRRPVSGDMPRAQSLLPIQDK